MYKKILFFVCILFIFSSSNVFKESKSHYFKEDCDRILWSSKRKVVWDDFRGIPDTSRTNVGALTSSKIEITENYILNDIPKYVVQCHFIRK